MVIDFKGSKCRIEFGLYGNGQKAIQLFDCRDGQLFSVATVAIDDNLDENEVAIKDYSENEGTLDELIKEGIVSEPKWFARSGFVKIPVCDLLIDFVI